jgi:sorting nexin-3/12
MKSLVFIVEDYYAAYLFRVAGHPLAQNERCLHMFLLDPVIDKDYVPGKVRTT